MQKTPKFDIVVLVNCLEGSKKAWAPLVDGQSKRGRGNLLVDMTGSRASAITAHPQFSDDLPLMAPSHDSYADVSLQFMTLSSSFEP